MKTRENLKTNGTKVFLELFAGNRTETFPNSKIRFNYYKQNEFLHLTDSQELAVGGIGEAREGLGFGRDEELRLLLARRRVHNNDASASHIRVISSGAIDGQGDIVASRVADDLLQGNLAV